MSASRPFRFPPPPQLDKAESKIVAGCIETGAKSHTHGIACCAEALEQELRLSGEDAARLAPFLVLDSCAIATVVMAKSARWEWERFASIAQPQFEATAKFAAATIPPAPEVDKAVNELLERYATRAANIQIGTVQRIPSMLIGAGLDDVYKAVSIAPYVVLEAALVAAIAIARIAAWSWESLARYLKGQWDKRQVFAFVPGAELPS